MASGPLPHLSLEWKRGVIRCPEQEKVSLTTGTCCSPPRAAQCPPNHPEMHFQLLQHFWGGQACQGAEASVRISAVSWVLFCRALFFPGALSWGFWTVPGRAASSLPLGLLGATTTQMTEIISLMSKLLSKLKMLPFHNNKVDALQFLRNKSDFRHVLQIGNLDFTLF